MQTQDTTWGETLVQRAGYWFEKSGDSLAVYSRKPEPWNGVAPSLSGQMRSWYIDRFDLIDASYASFLRGIKEWLDMETLRCQRSQAEVA